MTKTIDAVYDGKVLHLSEPLKLQPNTHVRVTIETKDNNQAKALSFLKTAMSLSLDGPPDWSKRLEEYLYGTNDQPLS